MLNANLRKNYRSRENIIVDEQLSPFRDRTRFIQYIPTKPGKYGIKLWWVCDAKTNYPVTGQIYSGKSCSAREKNQGESTKILEEMHLQAEIVFGWNHDIIWRK